MPTRSAILGMAAAALLAATLAAGFARAQTSDPPELGETVQVSPRPGGSPGGTPSATPTQTPGPRGGGGRAVTPPPPPDSDDGDVDDDDLDDG